MDNISRWGRHRLRGFRQFCSKAGAVLLFASVSFQHPIYLYAIRYVILPCAAKICPDLIWSCKPSETKIIVEIFYLEFYENSFYCGCKDSKFLNALSVLLPTFSNLGNKIWSKKYPRLRWGLQAGANQTNSISFSLVSWV